MEVIEEGLINSNVNRTKRYVYGLTLFDQIVYVGITKNKLRDREMQHKKLGKVFHKIIVIEEGLYTDTEIKQVEDKYIDLYGTLDNGYNKMKSAYISDETRRKMSEARTGKKDSKETIAKRVAQYSGENHWLYGKSHREETKEKISKTKKLKDILGVQDLLGSPQPTVVIPLHF